MLDSDIRAIAIKKNESSQRLRKKQNQKVMANRQIVIVNKIFRKRGCSLIRPDLKTLSFRAAFGARCEQGAGGRVNGEVVVPGQVENARSRCVIRQRLVARQLCQTNDDLYQSAAD
jgi:hypothetical protein